MRVAIGRHVPTLVALPPAPIVSALRALDELPAGCPDLAHRMVLHGALTDAGVHSTPLTAPSVARDLVAPRVSQ